MAIELEPSVLIDTNVLIFSLLQEKNDVNDESPKARYAHFQSQNAKSFLLKCIQNHREVCVSSISLSEIMERLNDEDAKEMFSLVSRFYTILPFDRNAAFQAGRLAYSLHKLDAQKSSENTKIRNDIYILATGLQHNCKSLYTTDKVLVNQATRLSIPMKPHLLSSFESSDGSIGPIY